MNHHPAHGHARNVRAAMILGVLAVCAPVRELPTQQAARGRVHEIVVRGASLAGNVLGISAERTVSVYLPPSYDRSSRRYPVVYVLHGIMDSHRTWTVAWDQRHAGSATIQDVMDRGIAAGTLREMIVVVPDAEKSCHYTDSPVKGGWGSFVANDLVSAIDRAYRTVATPDARGIMGHSMGGHGAIKLAMTHPGVFSTVVALNPSLLGWGGDVSGDNARLAAASRLRTPADVQRADFYTQAVIGIGQCFSPDLNAPLLTALPFQAGANGAVERGPAYDRWSAQMPVFMAREHSAALKALRGLRFDSAFEDEFSHIPITSRAFSALLDSLGVVHTFEMYNGDHRNRIWGPQGRLAAVALPYFSALLGDSAGVVAGAATRASSAPAPANARRAAEAQARLWKAAIEGDINDADAALKAGADIHALDTTMATAGRRAINYAAEHNRAAMIRWLVEHGADVNRANTTGFTPLHHAAESGSVAAVEALLALGANPKATLPSGSTPLMVARQRGKTDVVRVLQNAGGG